MNDTEYREKLEELLPLARRAFGSRTHDTPEHNASREYTRLLVEYYENGGSLVAMAQDLGVTYASLRRRVATYGLEPRPSRTRSRLDQEQTDAAIERIREAKNKSPEEYHAQILEEYENGVSLAKVADALGLSSSAPLYFGVQQARIRENA